MSFYCFFGLSKGIKLPVLKHQKRDKIGMLKSEKMHKNVWKKPCFQSFFRSKNKVIVDFVTCFFSLVMKGKCKTSLGVTMKNLLKRVTFSEATQAKELNKRSSFFYILGGISHYLSDWKLWIFLSYLSFHHSHLIIRFSFCQLFLTRNLKVF